MIPNPYTKEAFQFSQRLYQLAKQGIKIKFILAPKEKEKKFYQKLKDIENIEFALCYNIHMKIVLDIFISVVLVIKINNKIEN